MQGLLEFRVRLGFGRRVSGSIGIWGFSGIWAKGFRVFLKCNDPFSA